jgi:hypothetical protein
MWFLPSRGRPHLIARVFERSDPITTPGVLGIDDDQVDLYLGVSLPHGWTVHVQPRTFLSAKVNNMLAAYPDEPWYGLICDDQQGWGHWDRALVGAAGRRRVAWGDDGLHHRLGVSVFGGDLVRAIGWLCCPTIKHFYIDDAHELIVRELGCGVPCMGVQVPHLHFTTGETPFDKTYEERPDIEECRIAFEAWRETEWPDMLARLRKEGFAC